MRGYLGSKVYTEQQGKQEAMVYCSKEERTQKDVFEKLLKWGLTAEEADNVLASLISDNFINEERYARLYAKSKFHQNKWGKTKIRFYLSQKGLSKKCIEKGLEEIDDKEYYEICLLLAKQKFNSLSGNGDLLPIKRKKAVIFLNGKGFEFDIINKTLDTLCAK